MEVKVYVSGVKDVFRFAEKDEKGAANRAYRVMQDGVMARMEGGAVVFYPPHRITKVELEGGR